MRVEDVPDPEPGPGEVLIRVHAVSVNRTLDLVVRAGKYSRPVTLPLVPGVDPAGVIARLGPDVRGRKVGDRVVTAPRVDRESKLAATRLLGVPTSCREPEYVNALAHSRELT